MRKFTALFLALLFTFSCLSASAEDTSDNNSVAFVSDEISLFAGDTSEASDSVEMYTGTLSANQFRSICDLVEDAAENMTQLVEIPSKYNLKASFDCLCNGNHGYDSERRFVCTHTEPSGEMVTIVIREADGTFVGHKDTKYHSFYSTDLRNIMGYLLHSKPELFNLKNQYGITFNGFSLKISKIALSFKTTSEAVQAERLSEYTTALQKIVKSVPKGISDTEKVVWLHDYLVEHYQYDVRYYDSEQKEDTVYDAYNFLMQKKGVCEAYVLTFNGIMEKLGIKCFSAINYTHNHVWNIVELNGKYYHIDATWDDPTHQDPDTSAVFAGTVDFIGHSFLLLSDAAVASSHPAEHIPLEDYEGNKFYCDDTTYDDFAWRDSVSPLVYSKNGWYMVKDYTLYSIGKEFKNIENPTALHTFYDRWDAGGSGSWIGFFSGMFAIGNTIYGNTNGTIWRYHLYGKEASRFDELRMDGIGTDSTNQIFGCTYDGNGIISFITKTDPNHENEHLYSFKLNLGDSDGDNIVGASDLVNARKFISFNDTDDFDYGLLDMNDDNEVNLVDLVILKKDIA